MIVLIVLSCICFGSLALLTTFFVVFWANKNTSGKKVKAEDAEFREIG